MELLYRSAIDAGAKIDFNAVVEGSEDDTERPSVVLRDGRCMSADLILSADGIRSHIWNKILSDLPNSDPITGDITMYGIRLSTQQLRADALAKKLVATETLMYGLARTDSMLEGRPSSYIATVSFMPSKRRLNRLVYGMSMVTLTMSGRSTPMRIQPCELYSAWQTLATGGHWQRCRTYIVEPAKTAASSS